MELVVLCGLQASGKTTFRRERFVGHVVVSKDLMGSRSGKEQRQRRLVDRALADGHSVVVDNTNPSAVERMPLVEIGRLRGAACVGFFFEADFDGCVRRNADRPVGEVVPMVGLLDVHRRLRVPTLDEGFDQLWRVRLGVGGGFDVEPLVAVGDG